MQQASPPVVTGLAPGKHQNNREKVLFPSLRIPGDNFDIESYKRLNGFQAPVLVIPWIPFREQAFPLPDFQNRHTISIDVNQATQNRQTNPLPYNRFVGTSEYQANQPSFLSVNEKIYSQGQSW